MICICLDDFGLSAGINQAALQLAGQGRLQAVSCMVGAPFFKAGVAQLRQLGPIHIDIGLHLDLTEAPLLAASRRSLRGLVIDSLLGRVDRQALREEIRMQLDTFEQTLGRPPDHVDGHQHVHQLPGVRDELLDELSLRSATVRPWLRSTRSAAQGGSWRARFKPLVIEQLGDAALRAAAAKRGFRQNNHLLGVYDFQGGARAYVSQLERWLQVASPGDLLMCHAGLGEAADDPIATARRAEFDVLSGRHFADLMAVRQIKLQPMSDILGERGDSK
ncbi:MAG: ChbG/HpnK family deacetylase [Ideonella sp.]